MGNEVTDSNKQDGEADEKGVPFSNRMKEMERKFQERIERLEREQQEYKTAMAGSHAAPPVATSTNGASNAEEINRNILTEFVKDPDGFVKSRWQRAQVEREMGQVKPWFQSQPGYREDDDARIMAIETEYQLAHQSPLERAKACWNILQKEKKLAELSGNADDRRREASVGASTTEGAGKAAPKQAPVTRMDIVKKLAKAEAEGDLDSAIRYTSMLEDIR